MKKIENLWIFIIFFVIVFFSAIWALYLPVSNWPTDYGHHFYISLANSNKELYKDFFTHKGPTLVLFIDFFQFFLGNDWKASIIILFLLSLIFLTISIYVTQKITKNYAISFLILLYLIFFYRYQTSDIFVDLIILPLIFLGFLNFYEFIINEKESNLILAYFFLFLSILGRIDTVLYLISLIFFHLLYAINEKKKNFINYKLILKISLLLVATFFFLSFMYSFNLYEFIDQNIFFNILYSEHDYFKFKNLGNLYAYMPYKHYVYFLFIKLYFYYSNKNIIPKYICYFLLVLTLIQTYFFLYKVDALIIFLLIFLFEICSILFLVVKNKYFKEYSLLMILILNFVSFFTFLYSGSSKLNHGFLLLAGSTFLGIFFLNYIINLNIKFKKIIKIILIFLFVYQSEKIIRSNFAPVFKDQNFSLNNGLENLYYNSDQINNNEIIKLLKKDNPPIICDKGWLHIFSNTQSNSIMFDWWFYDTRKQIISKENQIYINKIISKKFGNYFLIDRGCAKGNMFNQSPKIKKLLNSSYLYRELSIFDKYYEMRVIN